MKTDVERGFLHVCKLSLLESIWFLKEYFPKKFKRHRGYVLHTFYMKFPSKKKYDFMSRDVA